MPSPSAAGVIAATVYAWPYALPGVARSATALAIVLVPAALMVSTIRFRSFKAINLGWAPSYMPLFLFGVFIVLIAIEPRITLMILSYGYLLSPFVGMALTRLRGRPGAPPPAA